MIKSLGRSYFAFLCLSLVAVTFHPSRSHAVQLDWSGQFWFDTHYLNNYQLDRGRPGYDSDSFLYNKGGPYVPGTGEKSVAWFAAFMRVKPKVIVNDNIQIKSEWHLGNPVYGFFGRDVTTTGGEQYNFTGAQKDGAAITAQRFWANLITDFGVIELGRAPIHWALGAFWHSGDRLFDRYQSSGDMVRLTSKFGNLSVSPAISKVSIGNNVAGALNTSVSTPSFPGLSSVRDGNDDVTDYHVAVRYDNTEEDFDFGLMWTRRTGNAAQSTIRPSSSGNPTAKLNFNVFDFYAKKKLGRFSFGFEVPLFTGTIGSIDGSANEFEYKTVAAIFESNYTSDQWDIGLKAGHVPGQQTVTAARNAANAVTAFVDPGAKYRAVYLNKNYGLGLIMFHYNLYGLTANNPDNLTSSQVNSPYDAPIVNANYVSLSPTFKLDKWQFHLTGVAAWATETVPNFDSNNPQKFYNHQRRQWFDVTYGSGNQQSFMGWEVDGGTTFKWDDHYVMDWTVGFFFPGAYYKFANNTAPLHENSVSSFMFASQLRAGITF